MIQAIFEYRLPRLHERRTLLIAERRPNDLRGWVECQLRTVFEQSELDGSYYVSFLAMLAQHRRRDALARLPVATRDTAATFVTRLGSYLDRIPQPLRSHRIAMALALIIYAAADRERARVEGHPVCRSPSKSPACLTGSFGFLEAPVSAEAHDAATAVGPAIANWASF